jgi:hypothetical protein
MLATILRLFAMLRNTANGHRPDIKRHKQAKPPLVVAAGAL